jgi:rod shape-determining protein MreC
LLFLFLEFISLWLTVRSNPYHSAAYFHSSSQMAGSLYATRQEMIDYLNLKEVNKTLAEENASLRQSISEIQKPMLVAKVPDSARVTEVNFKYQFLSAKVINNTTRFNHNFITINKGYKHGIQPGMGVINTNGVVGKIMATSENFAVLASLLNIDMFVSSVIRRNNTFCSINWDGRDPQIANALYIPRHINLQEGDTILTSGFNAVFPENIMIGTIERFSLKENATFYDVGVKLAPDFAQLSYVYLIENPKKQELDSLELSIDLYQSNP